MNWAAQKRALVSLPKNCGTDPGWYDQSLFTDTEYTGLLPVSLRMDPELLTFVINFCLLSVPNIHCEQRGTSSFIVTNISGKTPSFSSLNMDLGFRWYNLSCKHLIPVTKIIEIMETLYYQFVLVQDYWIHWCNPVSKLEFIQCLVYSLIWGTHWWIPLCFRAWTWWYNLCSWGHWYLCPPDPRYNYVPHFCILGSQKVWKVIVVVGFFVESLQTFFDGSTRGMYNLCETASLITSY